MTGFEKECDAIDNIYTGDTMQENCIEWLRGAKTVTVNLCNNRYAGKVRKLAEQYPEDVQIVNDSEGVLLAHVPISYIKISAPRTKNMTEEQRLAIAERARNNFGKRNEDEDDDEE